MLSRSHHRLLKIFSSGASLASTIMLAVGVSPAVAASPSAGWAISSQAEPTVFSFPSPSGCQPTNTKDTADVCDRYTLLIRNAGSRPTSGSVMVADTPPAGLAVTAIAGYELERGGPAEGSTEEHAMTCTATPLECVYAAPVPAGGVLIVTINVEVTSGIGGVAGNSAIVSGGEAAAVSTSGDSTSISSLSPPFGLDGFGFEANGVDGGLDTQAGDHPDSVTASMHVISLPFQTLLPVQDVKDVIVDLPPGLVGDPQATPRCPLSSLNGSGGKTSCPPNSEIGTLIFQGGSGSYHMTGVQSGGTSGIYNVIPEAGYPAEFGFNYLGHVILMYANVISTSSGYTVRVTVPSVPRVVALIGATLTFFGDPGSQNGTNSEPNAFLTNPVNCSAGAQQARIAADSWGNPGVYTSRGATTYPQVTGCNMLRFQPTIRVAPETTVADEPSGYTVDLTIPQSPKVSPSLATPELKDATVTLPEGVSVSPAAADGLLGCSETGSEGINLGSGDVTPQGQDLGDPQATELGAGHAGGNGSPYDDGLYHAAHGHCPDASILGTVEVTTPLLASPLQGHVFLAQPKCGGEGQPGCTEADATNGNLFGLYIEAEGSGVIIKLKGTVSANPSTGQLTATFKGNPQLPFSDLKLQITGGPRAPLANPPGASSSCGPQGAKTTSLLVPWSTPETPTATPSSSFAVSGCSNPPPFAPSFSAGTVNPQAGVFSPFTLTFSRHDREQSLAQITVNTPPGLLGKIAGIPQCPEAQANTGACSPASQIGTASAAAGAGSHPFWVTGPVYLTGPYKGAPFGLSVVVPAKAGPFNLGDEIVRSAIHVDPRTAQLTVISDPLPQKLDGVPFRLQTVNVTIDKQGFMFNPTNCDQQQITGTITSAQGTSAQVSSSFAAAGCANLPFKPAFSASTQAKTSKANGASLVVKVAQKPGEANIHKVDLQLPLALPSRLTTLQKACTEAQFNANPAGCPEGSVIGTAKALTPVLNVPLTGPAYLVSHGGAAFPDVEFILQGEGVEILLDGKTDIKKGITYSRFETVPDAPISSFETVLPEGPHSALAAFGNLCTQSLAMPTTITGQNGAQVAQSTKVAVAGCRPVTISNRRLSGKHVVLTFFLTAKGAVTVTGPGLRRYRKTLAAGSHQITVALSKAGLAARRRHRKTTIKVALKTGAKVSSSTTTLKL
jgi:hypothetical protein